jgi:hypothetical protein
MYSAIRAKVVPFILQLQIDAAFGGDETKI